MLSRGGTLNTRAALRCCDALSFGSGHAGPYRHCRLDANRPLLSRWWRR
jgi:hypothetical protein